MPLDPTTAAPSAPTLWQARHEWRAAIELASSAVRTRDLAGWPRGDGHPVIVLPGFLAGPESTLFLRQHLRRLGYRVHDWRQGRNLGASPELAERLDAVLGEIHERYGRRVSLLGWSAGGVYAREMARSQPQYTRSVVTLGSPFRHHPAATRAWAMYRVMNRHNLDLMFTDEALALRARPLEVPTTSIYSRTDGIVAWECCVADPAPRTENVEVSSTHLGYGHQLETLRIVADRLAQPEDAWQPWSAPAEEPERSAAEEPDAPSARGRAG
ncbi:alpha/beta hydrolase [Phycicoccus endophyticus]|uniref:Alpha/beta hydrolase n=1 Tax=Phycicoccus endophyticus TaxID=1690220 RepID=A0A7G9R0I8_9MICO|nr:alpha/beta hydrolase [Phycicoccus endophyticus]NHI19390.1 alpha/beta hydrolase [Phycicoccus endophyticus]QNN49113.1 alpha/beta hydrolase [Phycicoccus endophyticus]GGL38710.1 hypothetical protein GCM10012283_21570 [Phycicoccus endophyticus]